MFWLKLWEYFHFITQLTTTVNNHLSVDFCDLVIFLHEYVVQSSCKFNLNSISFNRLLKDIHLHHCNICEKYPDCMCRTIIVGSPWYLFLLPHVWHLLRCYAGAIRLSFFFFYLLSTLVLEQLSIATVNFTFMCDRIADPWTF